MCIFLFALFYCTVFSSTGIIILDSCRFLQRILHNTLPHSYTYSGSQGCFLAVVWRSRQPSKLPKRDYPFDNMYVPLLELQGANWRISCVWEIYHTLLDMNWACDVWPLFPVCHANSTLLYHWIYQCCVRLLLSVFIFNPTLNCLTGVCKCVVIKLLLFSA